MQRRTANLLALAALGAITTGPALAKAKSEDTSVSFTSQEEAIEHIATALRAADLHAALAAFGIERRVADYKFVKMAERQLSILLTTAAPPVQFPFYQDVAASQFTHEAVTQLRNLVYSLLAPSWMALDKATVAPDRQDIGQFARDLEVALDPSRLANLIVLRTAVPNAEIANSEQFRRTIAAQLAVTGGDDLEERFVLYDLDGQTYRSGLTLVRYGDRWQVRTLVANLGGTSPAGYAVPMSEEEFIYITG